MLAEHEPCLTDRPGEAVGDLGQGARAVAGLQEAVLARGAALVEAARYHVVREAQALGGARGLVAHAGVLEQQQLHRQALTVDLAQAAGAGLLLAVLHGPVGPGGDLTGQEAEVHFLAVEDVVHALDAVGAGDLGHAQGGHALVEVVDPGLAGACLPEARVLVLLRQEGHLAVRQAQQARQAGAGVQLEHTFTTAAREALEEFGQPDAANVALKAHLECGVLARAAAPPDADGGPRRR